MRILLALCSFLISLQGVEVLPRLTLCFSMVILCTSQKKNSSRSIVHGVRLGHSRRTFLSPVTNFRRSLFWPTSVTNYRLFERVQRKSLGETLKSSELGLRRSSRHLMRLICVLLFYLHHRLFVVLATVFQPRLSSSTRTMATC